MNVPALLDLYTSLSEASPQTIPDQLKAHHFWLNWFPSQSPDNPDKILKKPLLGKVWQNQLTTYERVYSKAESAAITQFIGYGLAYTPDHPFVCIDIDEQTEENLTLVSQLDSYTEVSPSKKGLHVIVALPSIEAKASLIAQFGNGQRNLSNKRDLFIATGYVTVTGLLSSHNTSSIRTLSLDELINVLSSYFKTKDLVGSQSSELALTVQAPEKAYPPAYIRSLLDKVPVRNLPSDIFLRLSNNEPVILDPLCDEEAREPWLIIGQAIHHHYKGGVTGYQLWDAWSAQGNKYSKEALDSVWQSFSATTVGRAITIASLIKLVDSQTTSYPDLDTKGRALGTLKNFKVYLAKTGVTVSINALDKQVHFNIPDEKQAEWGVCQDFLGIDTLSEILLSELTTNKAALQAFNRVKVKNFLISVASVNITNPIQDYFNRVKDSWDGQDYINALLGTMTFSKKHHLWAYKLFLRKWLIQVTAAACHKPEESVRLNRVLILTGAQGIGKTRWVESLFPKDLRKYCAGDKELKLGKFKSESTKLAMELTSTLICNINEIDRLFNSSGYADFKAFLDQTTDNIVLPYGDRPVELTRRTVFIGSCNEENFLQDTTGNRRFETIPLLNLNHTHSLDIDQLWGQVMSLYLGGEKWWFDHNNPDDIKICQFRDASNEQSMAIPLAFMFEELSTVFDMSAPIKDWKPLTLADIRSLIGLTRTNGRESLPLNQIKQTLNTWRAQLPDAPAPYAASKSPRAFVLYPMPPLATLEDSFPSAAFALAETRDAKSYPPPPVVQ